MTWIDCTIDNDYEIFNEYPFTIRKKSNQRIVNESINNIGYLRCKLNGNDYLKHRIIATQFIPNPNNLSFIDHINHNRIDNRLINLRWVSSSENNRNKSSNKGIEYNYLDDIPDESIVVNDYGKYKFENYYYDEETDKFYFFNGQQYRELHINETKDGLKFVCMLSTENKKIKLYYSTFKKMYDLI